MREANTCGIVGANSEGPGAALSGLMGGARERFLVSL